MDQKQLQWLTPKVVIGIGVIAFGISELFSSLGLPLPDDLGLIIFGLVLFFVGLGKMGKTREERKPISGLIFMLIGASIVLINMGIIQFGAKLLIPGVLLLVGYKLFRQGVDAKRDSSAAEDYVNASSIIGGGNHRFANKTLKGGNVMAIMGGCTLDLREAEIDPLEDQIVIDAFAFWGSVEILIPHEWNVNIHAIPFMGSIENKTRTRSIDINSPRMEIKNKTLVLKGAAIMGGVEVKN